MISTIFQLAPETIPAKITHIKYRLMSSTKPPRLICGAHGASMYVTLIAFSIGRAPIDFRK